MSLISAGSISLDSTFKFEWEKFKIIFVMRKIYDPQIANPRIAIFAEGPQI